MKKIVAIIWQRLKAIAPYLSPSLDTKELQNRNLIINQMVRSFSIEELDLLAFNSGINPDQIAGKTINERAFELVRYAERNGILSLIVATCAVERPLVRWPEI